MTNNETKQNNSNIEYFEPEYKLTNAKNMPIEAINVCALWYTNSIINTDISAIKKQINNSDFAKLPLSTQTYLNSQSKFNTLPEFGKNTAYDLVFKPIIEMYQNKAGIQAKSIVSPIRSKIQNSK